MQEAPLPPLGMILKNQDQPVTPTYAYCLFFILIGMIALGVYALFSINLDMGIFAALVFSPAVLAVVIGIYGNVYCALNMLLFNIIAASPYFLQLMLSNENIADLLLFFLRDKSLIINVIIVTLCGVFVHTSLPKIIRIWLMHSIKNQRQKHMDTLQELRGEWLKGEDRWPNGRGTGAGATEGADELSEE